MTEDWESLMEEPPHGANHGRRKAADGEWHKLELEEQRAMQGGLRVNEDIQLYIRPKKPLETIAHGTPAAYTNDKCRCVDCKRAWAAYTKRRRNV